MTNPKRVALYTRVSTDRQTTERQRRELREAAERHGWTIRKNWSIADFERVSPVRRNALAQVARPGKKEDLHVPFPSPQRPARPVDPLDWATPARD